MKHDESWLKKKGWRKVYGYKLDLRPFKADDFILFENYEDLVESANYYTNEQQKFEELIQAVHYQEVVDEENGVIEIDGL
jgi:hypothetical protein